MMDKDQDLVELIRSAIRREIERQYVYHVPDFIDEIESDGGTPHDLIDGCLDLNAVARAVVAELRAVGRLRA